MPSKNRPSYEELTQKIQQLEAQLIRTTANRDAELAQVQKELDLKNTFIDTVLQNLPIGITVTQYSTGRRQFLNRKFEEIYGWPKEELMEMGKFFRNVFPDPDVRRQVRKVILEDLRKGDPSRMQWGSLPVTTKTGEKRTVSGISIPLFDQDLVIGAAMDNTENYHTLKQLQESEERYRALFDRSFDCIAVCDFEGNILDVNTAALNILEYTAEEIEKLAIWQITAPRQRRVLEESRDNILSDGYEARLREFKIITRSGKVKIIEIRGASIQKNGVPYAILVIGRDITDRKQSEMELERKVVSLNQAEIIAKLGYYERNVQTGEIFRSDGYYKLIGISPEEGKAKEVSIYDYTHDQDREMVREHLEAFSRRHEPIDMWFRLTRRSGEVITLHVIGRTIFDEQHQPLINTRVFRNISEEKKLEEQLRQSQKMESIGTLAGGIAHDFNNILSIIIGNMDLALEDISPRHTVREYISESRKASIRGKDIVRQLLNFSRKTEEAKDSIDMTATIMESLKLLRSSIPATVDIVPHIQKETRTVMADETQIHQIMINLCSNAVDAMTGQGRIDVTLTDHTEAGDGPADTVLLQPGNYVCLSVCDTGTGMDEVMLSRIFDPYFTTKEIGRGTGMGLAVVHGIVQSHDGIMDVRSTVGKGSCFDIYFPAVQHENRQVKLQTEKPSRGSGRILLVDDETAIVELNQRILAKYGYDVVGCSKPEEALAIFKSGANDFDLVVTDMAMPAMTGIQLSEKIHGIRPELPIVLCSGYTDERVPDQNREPGIAAFILKPVDLKTLVETVGAVLKG